MKEFQFKPLTENEIVNIMSKTDAVFDICNENQNGLTMRTIETLGAGKKLITTNKTIINYDFYSPNNILLVKNNDFSDIHNFLKTRKEDLDYKIYNEYALKCWINKIIR